MQAKLIIPITLILTLLGFNANSQSDIPKPSETLGFEIGADYHLASYTQSLSYFQKLAASSDKMQMIQAGYTSNGQPWYFSVISSSENIQNLNRYREIAQRLAHPSGLSDEEAKLLSLEGKPIVHIDGGLHATEVAGAQHTISLAYELIRDADTPAIKEILDNVIILLWPSLNPDGQNMVADWYSSNVGTPYEVAPLPALYQKYIGHDNNRDAYMLNMIESRVVARTWREWEPNIIYVHHQTAPSPTRIWLPPFAEPIASQTPPLIAREVNMIGMAIAQALETNGQEGSVHMGTGFDAWYPGYIDYMPVLQNIPSFWTETALYRYATPKFYTVSDFPKNRIDLRIESLYNSPWKGGWWRIKDAIDYMQTASKAVLEYAAKYGQVILYNRYQAGRNTIKKYTQEPPFAYFMPVSQRDPVRPAELLKRLAFNGIKIGRLSKTVTFDGITHSAGTWIIPLNQEFGELARQLMDIQNYPDLREYPDGPPEQPYDAAGWSLPLQFEVKVIAAASPLTEDVKNSIDMIEASPVDWKSYKGDASTTDIVPGVGYNTNATAAAILPPPNKLTGSGNILIVDPKENNAYRLLTQAMKAGAEIKFLNSGEGRYSIRGVSRNRLANWANDLAVNGTWTNKNTGVKVGTRIGLYRPWAASMDEGWTRWLFEQFGFDYSNINSSDLDAGDLNDRFDVIVMPSERTSRLQNGFSKGSVPPRYEGGIGTVGGQSLDAFVRNGGTLVCLNQSSEFAIETLHLPIKNVVAGIPRKEYFAGLSILEVETDTSHPVMAGMPERANVFVSRSPVFTTTAEFKGQALAKYALHGSPLRSGYLLGESHLQGFAAALDVYHGKGHVLLLGFAPQWRGQPMGTYRVLFNSILYGSALSKDQVPNTDFWIAPEPKPEVEKVAEEK